MEPFNKIVSTFCFHTNQLDGGLGRHRLPRSGRAFYKRTPGLSHCRGSLWPVVIGSKMRLFYDIIKIISSIPIFSRELSKFLVKIVISFPPQNVDVYVFVVGGSNSFS